MSTDHTTLLARLHEALPKVGESEDVWCSVQGHDLRAAIAALAQPAVSEPVAQWSGCHDAAMALPPSQPAVQAPIAQVAFNERGFPYDARPYPSGPAGPQWMNVYAHPPAAQPAVPPREPLTSERVFEIWERAAQIDLSGRVNELIRTKDAQCVIRAIVLAAQEQNP